MTTSKPDYAAAIAVL